MLLRVQEAFVFIGSVFLSSKVTVDRDIEFSLDLLIQITTQLTGPIFFDQGNSYQEGMRRVGTLQTPSDESSGIVTGSSRRQRSSSEMTHPLTTLVSQEHQEVHSVGRNMADRQNTNMDLESVVGIGIGHVPDTNSSFDDSFHTFPRQSGGELPTTTHMEAQVALNESFIDAEVVVTEVETEVVQLSEDPPLDKVLHARIKLAAAVIFSMVLAAIVGFVVLLLLLRRRDEGKPQSTVIPRTTAPSSAPLDPLFMEIEDVISPTEEDLLLFADPTSPQSMTLQWLRDDPITSMPDRSTRTVLERYVLAVLYFSASGHKWLGEYEYLTDADVCDWHGESADSSGSIPDGVSCQSSNGTVNTINLVNNNLHGTIPWEIVLLSDLSYLAVSRNFLDGEIPSRIAEMTRLSYLDLSSNFLMEVLPQALPTSLLNLQLMTIISQVLSQLAGGPQCPIWEIFLYPITTSRELFPPRSDNYRS